MALAFEETVANLISDRVVFRALRKRFGKAAEKVIIQLVAREMPECDGVHVHDFLADLLANEGRLYRQFTARGSAAGKYPIQIRGLGGVYYYQANEFGTRGYFLSLEEAEESVRENWTDDLVSHAGRRYRDAFIDPIAAAAAAKSAEREAVAAAARAKKAAAKNLQRASRLLEAPPVSSDSAKWKKLLAGPSPEDPVLCAKLAKQWVETVGPDGHAYHPWFLTNPRATVASLMHAGDEHVVRAMLKDVERSLLASEEKWKMVTGPARMGSDVGRWRDEAEVLRGAVHSLRSASGTH